MEWDVIGRLEVWVESLPESTEYILLTGSTGLLGRYLLRDFLRAGRRLAVVVRPAKNASPRQRIETILQRWESEDGCLYPRPVIVEGNVSEPLLGFDKTTRHWVQNHCSSILHSAAVLAFDEDQNGEPWRTNVAGTRHLLDVCNSCHIRQLHYVSTAYVAGRREDRVLEHELDCGQKFRNAYEDSKFQAETLMRQASFLRSLTVYRPAVIAGDSRTGYTTTYHGLYLYLKLMSVLVWNTKPGPDGVRFTPVRLDMTGDEPRNVVPVDWVSAVVCHLFGNPEAHGRTFHLAPDRPITPREVIEAGYKFFNSRGVEFLRSDDCQEPISQMDRDAHENMTIYKAYEASDPCFDTSNLSKFAAHLPCPLVDEAMLHRFWKYGEEDRWGKRRERQAEAECGVVNYLESATQRQTSGTHEFRGVIGIDIVGPGGGQWSLCCKDGRVELDPGIAPHCERVASMSSAEFAQLMPANENGESRPSRQNEQPDAAGEIARLLTNLLAPKPASAT